jgi:hypothetical protein
MGPPRKIVAWYLFAFGDVFSERDGSNYALCAWLARKPSVQRRVGPTHMEDSALAWRDGNEADSTIHFPFDPRVRPQYLEPR